MHRPNKKGDLLNKSPRLGPRNKSKLRVISSEEPFDGEIALSSVIVECEDA
jgi:hypothetical protein